ncbi:MAG: hypothetical protein GY930_00565 [bacterium]|nr:hypothetical protein [bacterium]
MTSLQRKLTGMALATALFTSSTNAQTVLLDQQPTRGFSLTAHVGIESNAENFVVAGPASVTLNRVRWWGAWKPSGAPTTDEFDFIIHGNNSSGPFGDVPGATLQSFPGLVPTVVATGSFLPTASGLLDEFELEVSLPGGVSLAPGTYWVELFSTDSSGTGDEFVWGMADQDPVFGGPCVSWSASTPGVTWNACTPFPSTDFAVMLFEDAGSITFCDPANLNSTGASTTLSSSFLTGGGISGSMSDLHLECTNGVPSELGYFLVGTTSDDPGVVISNGQFCLSSAPFFRYNVAGTTSNSVGRFSAAGVLENLAGTSSIGPMGMETGFDVPDAVASTPQVITAGSTWHFQVWHRDTPAAVGSSNFSNGVSVTF